MNINKEKKGVCGIKRGHRMFQHFLMVKPEKHQKHLFLFVISDLINDYCTSMYFFFMQGVCVCMSMLRTPLIRKQCSYQSSPLSGGLTLTAIHALRKFKEMLELNAQIRLIPKPFYTCGDTVRGKLLVFTSKPISVRNIEVKLRCDENAYNDVDSQVIGGSSYIHEKTRHLSVDHVVFPDNAMVRHVNDDTQLTLSKGTHVYDFEFYLPDKIGDLQTFLANDCRSGIKWYIKGVVHRANTLERAARAVYDFPVYPIIFTPYDPLQLKEVREEDTFNMYLPGYSDKVRSTSGRFKELVSFNSSLRKHVNANFSLKIPFDGIPHAPASVPIQIDISSSGDNLLQVKRFELQLKYKCVVYTKKGKFRQVLRSLHNLFDIELNLPLDHAVQKIQEIIDDTIFERNLPATFKNEHFNLSYKMVGVVHLASIGNSSTTKKIRLSTPVKLRYLDRSPKETTPATEEIEYEEPELPVYEKYLPAGEMNLVG